MPTGGARARTCARGDHGFTVIESLTAAAILLVIAIGVITVLVTTSNWYAKARLRTQAYAIANQVMANILSRNYSAIATPTAGQTYPAGIPDSMSWPPAGTPEFTVKTSMETTTDAKTGLEVKLIAVSALPVHQSLDPTVTVSRYASGWQQKTTSAEKFPVTVTVQLHPNDANVLPPWDGARILLLKVDDLSEVYHAVTNESGLATFYPVAEGQYYVTCDPRFGSNIRPAHFPFLITALPSVSKGEASNKINGPFAIDVTRSSYGAVLRVGAYGTEGWTVVGGRPEPPEVPYRVIQGLAIYASPVLNTENPLEFYGAGAAWPYPDESQLIYEGVVNAYGVAAIPIPYTIDNTQKWKVWCRTTDAGVTTIHTLTTKQPGDWTTAVQRPEGASEVSVAYGDIPQWARLGTTATGVFDRTPPPPEAFLP